MTIEHQQIMSLVLMAYLLYMFRIHKTTFTVHHPLELWLMQRHFSFSDYFQHPFGSTAYGRKICPFGQDAILALVAFLGVRMYVETVATITPTLYGLSCVALGLTAIVSLMNMNAVVYLLPYFVHEMWWLGRVSS